ncbi:hypothetical protein CEE94_01185, partial [Lactobacillus crispatus]
VLLSVCVFFVQTNHTRKELLFLMFKEINLRNHSSLHKLFYSLDYFLATYADNISQNNNDYETDTDQLSS